MQVLIFQTEETFLIKLLNLKTFSLVKESYLTCFVIVIIST